MEQFCCIVVLSCYNLCVVLSVSCCDQFHVHCVNLGLMKCEIYVCMYSHFVLATFIQLRFSSEQVRRHFECV
jgi:hypothetical protein